MRPKLLQSFFIVIGFWLVATTLYWSFQKPEVNYQALLALAAFAQKIGLGSFIDATSYDPSIVGSFFVQKTVLLKWTLPVLVLTGLSLVIGGGVTWHGSIRRNKERELREKGKGVFRGVKLTVGQLPTPRAFPRDEVELSATDNESLAALTPKELALLNEIMGTISANEEAAATLPGGVSLVEHTLSQLGLFFKETKEGPVEHIGLTTLVIASLQLGYITAYAKGPNKAWTANGNKTHSSEAAFILSGLPAWFELETLERDALYLAVKFAEKPMSLPDLEGDVTIYPLAVVLIGQSSTYGAVPLNEAPKALASSKEEKVVNFADFNGPSALAQEDAAYTLKLTPEDGDDVNDTPAATESTEADSAPRAASPLQNAPKTSAPAPAPAPQAKETANAPPSPASRPAPLPTQAQPGTPAPANAVYPMKPSQISSATKHGLEVIASSNEDVEKIVFDTFIRLLPTMAFQHKGLPVGVKAVAWKQDLRVYMVEIKLRESVMAELPDSIRQTLQPGRDKQRVQPLTRLLFQIFHKKGWLVTQIDEMTVSPQEASWNLHAGTLDFRGVIVLDFPEEYFHQLPEKNSMYTLRITGPLYTSSATGFKKPENQAANQKNSPNTGKPNPTRPVNSQGAKKANQTSMSDLASVLGPLK